MENIIVDTGPTGSGKSVLMKKILENSNSLIFPNVEECIINYSVWQTLYEQIQVPFPIKFLEGITNIEDIPRDNKHRLIIIDDLMNTLSESQEVCDLYTKYSHHLNISVIILVQNLFEKGKYFRTISLNTHYLWLLKSVRDTSIISTLGRQMMNSKFLSKCYKDAVSKKFGHLFIDMKASSDDKYRVRSNTFDEEVVVYVDQ